MTASKMMITTIPNMDIKTSSSLSTFMSDYLLKIHKNLTQFSRNVVETTSIDALLYSGSGERDLQLALTVPESLARNIISSHFTSNIPEK